MNRILIVGATSAIAGATARLFAANGCRLCITGRNRARLEAVAHDLEVRGAAQVESILLDCDYLEHHEAAITHAVVVMGGVDAALIAHGVLPDQKVAEASATAAIESFHTNAVSLISLLTLLASLFERQGFGTLAVISSVAGDRGRKSNYVYGSAKASVSTFAEGLRHRFARTPVRVITVKPGLVDTPMTAAFTKGPLWANPESVAETVHRAMKSGRRVVYAPWYWKWIMRIVRAIPERLFIRTEL